MEKITSEGKQKLEEELVRLLEERPRIAKSLKQAISFGDLSENAEYSEIKERQEMIERRIAEIEYVIHTAKVVEKSSSPDVVHVGSVFEARDEESGITRTFTIVGKEESNPAEGKISFDSPIGAAFLKKKEGEQASFRAPSGQKTFTVLRIVS